MIFIQKRKHFYERVTPTRLFTFNDKINKTSHSNLVYKFKCNICNDICYGKAKYHSELRACENIGIIPLTRRKIKSPKESAVFDHIFLTAHKASADDFENLVKESDEFRLFLRESFLILRDDPPLSRYVKSIPLELFS